MRASGCWICDSHIGPQDYDHSADGVQIKTAYGNFCWRRPLNKDWYNQKIEQQPFVEACGAKYKALHNPNTMIEGVHEAVDIAKQERCPVVVGAAFDLQKLDWQGDIDFTKLKPAAVSWP